MKDISISFSKDTNGVVMHVVTTRISLWSRIKMLFTSTMVTNISVPADKITKFKSLMDTMNGD